MSLTGSSHHSRLSGITTSFTFGVTPSQTVGSLVLETSTTTSLVWSGLPITTLFKVDLSWQFLGVAIVTTPNITVSNGTAQLMYSKGDGSVPYIDIFSEFRAGQPFTTFTGDQHMVSYIILPASNGKVGVSLSAGITNSVEYGFDAFCIPIDQTILT